MAHDVFISYSVKNKSVADAITAKLENIKIRTWIAPRDIIPGDDWGESIINAIENSKIFVIILTEDSNQSQQVIREVERAVNMGIPIIPFRVEDVELSKSLQYFLSTTHWLDALTPPLEEHIDKLVDIVLSLKNTIEGKTTESEKEEAEELINKYSPSYKPKTDYNKFLRVIGAIISILALLISFGIISFGQNNFFQFNLITFILSLILLSLSIKPKFFYKLLKTKFDLKKHYKITIIILIILTIIVTPFSYLIGVQTGEIANKYDENGIYYEYPVVFNSNPSNTEENLIASYYMYHVNNGKELEYDFKIYKEILNTSLNEQYNYKNSVLKNDSTYSNIQEKNITINGVNAIDHNYLKNSNGNITEYREIWMEKNGYIYRLILIGPQDVFGFYDDDLNSLLKTFRFT